MTTILMVDDHELIRNGLAGAFRASGEFEVVGQAGSVAEALAAARKAQPEVVVTDVRLPDGSGLDIVRSLRSERPDIGLVVLTMYSGDEQLFAAMDAGASAFVGKDAPSSEVINAAKHAAVSPRTFTCTGLGEAMMRKMTSTSPRLSEREREVLDLLAAGLGVSAIASKLYVSESTTKSHITKIYDKLGAANRAQALVTAMRMGLLTDIERM
ncbi:DNA-binding response regulator [Nocardioides mangrovicus]|uniref:DNA-binding response regulator n=1 Tax=Nocardioides mangrovicus TaxID=2478913 RepID=A0A3L8P122_9ACTN|nr:response regulator transcription factor [Nocardioides mangrovicus]RLV49146.1 DNA-binding response regulator [Nocardioides mangrovicus]